MFFSLTSASPDLTQRLSVWGEYLTCQVLRPIAAVPGPVSELSARFLTTLWVAPQTVSHIWSLTLPSAYENKLIFLKDICTRLFSKWLVLVLTIKGDIMTFGYKTLKNQVSELLGELFHEKLWVYTIWPVVWLASFLSLCIWSNIGYLIVLRIYPIFTFRFTFATLT